MQYLTVLTTYSKLNALSLKKKKNDGLKQFSTEHNPTLDLCSRNKNGLVEALLFIENSILFSH